MDADFDTDGDVDGVDLTQWNGAFGVNNGSDADFDGDSDGNDFLIWQRQKGVIVTVAAASTLSVAVPEPAALMLLLASLFSPWSGRFAHRRLSYNGKPVQPIL